MEGAGISPLQSMLLAVLDRRPGIGVSELARLEGLRGPTISGHVKQMERLGLIKRTHPDCADRRRVGLTVTDEGRARLAHLRRHRRDWLAARLAALTPDDRHAITAAIEPLRQLGTEP